MEDGRDYDIFDKLIEGKQPFALFKRPGEGSVNLILQENRFQNEVFELDKIGDYSGFAVCPFNISRKTPLIVIQPDIYLKGENCIFEHLKQNSIYPGNTPINISGYKGVNVGKPERCAGSERLASSKSGKISLVPKEYFELYKNNFEIFHTVLQSSGFEKLVLSHAVDYKKDKSLSLGRVFKRAAEKYKDAFVYLCHAPRAGTWLGCSPELLISGKGSEWKTAALAGTVKIEDASLPTEDDGGADRGFFEWDFKNIKEHKIVVDFIKEQLVSQGIEFSESERYTIKAGSLRHLKSDFSFKLERNETGKLLKALYPTPAVCGSPKEETLRFVLENENGERRYYAGFIGPLNLDDSTGLFVNIRCMEMLDDTLRLYAGGGLINSSEPYTEWNETGYKMQTLLSII